MMRLHIATLLLCAATLFNNFWGSSSAIQIFTADVCIFVAGGEDLAQVIRTAHALGQEKRVQQGVGRAVTRLINESRGEEAVICVADAIDVLMSFNFSKMAERTANSFGAAIFTPLSTPGAVPDFQKIGETVAAAMWRGGLLFDATLTALASTTANSCEGVYMVFQVVESTMKAKGRANAYMAAMRLMRRKAMEEGSTSAEAAIVRCSGSLNGGDASEVEYTFDYEEAVAENAAAQIEAAGGW